MLRRQIASPTSKSGTPTASIGIASEAKVTARSTAEMPVTAKITPMKVLPVSPKKILAGWTLKRRNPRHAPASTSIASASGWFRPASRNHSAMQPLEMKASPEARPSMPSIRLKALTTKITQTTMNGRLTYDEQAKLKKVKSRRFMYQISTATSS